MRCYECGDLGTNYDMMVLVSQDGQTDVCAHERTYTVTGLKRFHKTEFLIDRVFSCSLEKSSFGASV